MTPVEAPADGGTPGPGAVEPMDSPGVGASGGDEPGGGAEPGSGAGGGGGGGGRYMVPGTGGGPPCVTNTG